MNLCNPGVIRELMARAGIRFRRDYGQNFLTDVTVPERIAEACSEREDTVVIEVGPGVGCLTRELAKRYERVIAIEIDRGLIPVLKETMAEYKNVLVINADVMKVNLSELLAEQGIDPQRTPVSVCANLPYYITTPILMRLLESAVPFRSITVMVQKEVADRLTARPGTADYGAITAVLGYYGVTEKLFSVPRSVFMPQPNVDSAVVRIGLYAESPYQVLDRQFLFRVIHGAFEMRRKTLLNALHAKCPEYTKEQITRVLSDMGKPEDIRGERLSTADFISLANGLLRLQ